MHGSIRACCRAVQRVLLWAEERFIRKPESGFTCRTQHWPCAHAKNHIKDPKIETRNQILQNLAKDFANELSTGERAGRESQGPQMPTDWAQC